MGIASVPMRDKAAPGRFDPATFGL